MDTVENKRSRYLVLDLLRGLAALGVLSFHVVVNNKHQLDGLYVLVDFFFVLSGFVLWPTMPQGRTSALREVARFIARRLLRLWPILLAAVMTSQGIYLYNHYKSGAFGWDPTHSWKMLLAASLFLQAIVSTSMFMVIPLWSLSAEVVSNVFYAPITRMQRNKPIVYSILFGYGLLNVGLTMDAGWWGWIGPIRHYEAIGRAILGFGLGLLVRKNLAKLKRFQNPVLLILASYGVWWSFFSEQGFGYNNLYFVSLIYAFFILQVVRYDFKEGSLLGKFAAFCGRYSYGVYAFHIVMIDATKKIITMPQSWQPDRLWLHYFLVKCSVVTFLAILATFVTQRLFERPIQKRFSR